MNKHIELLLELIRATIVFYNKTSPSSDVITMDDVLTYLSEKKSKSGLLVCPDCFDRGELRNRKEEIIGTCPCHY
jgi:ferredoxin-thioredoxin reductase catalytic subunit